MQFLKKWSKKGKIFVLVMLIFGIFGICFWCTLSEDNEIANVHSQIDKEYMYELTKADKTEVYEEPIYIDLNQEEEVLINEAGQYVLTGRLNGTVRIDAKDENVYLMLNGVDIEAVTGSAINVASAGKVIITVADGTENIIKDSTDYRDVKESNAAIWSACDLTLNGTGMLYVYGYYKDAIHTKDVCKIINGNIHLQAKRDGIRGNDGMLIIPQTLTIECEGAGLRTTKVDKEYKGHIDIAGGEVAITAGTYAVDAQGDVYVRDSNVSCLSVIDNMNVAGNEYIEEGCMRHE